MRYSIIEGSPSLSLARTIVGYDCLVLLSRLVVLPFLESLSRGEKRVLLTVGEQDLGRCEWGTAASSEQHD